MKFNGTPHGATQRRREQLNGMPPFLCASSYCSLMRGWVGVVLLVIRIRLQGFEATVPAVSTHFCSVNLYLFLSLYPFLCIAFSRFSHRSFVINPPALADDLQ